MLLSSHAAVKNCRHAKLQVKLQVSRAAAKSSGCSSNAQSKTQDVPTPSTLHPMRDNGYCCVTCSSKFAASQDGVSADMLQCNI